MGNSKDPFQFFPKLAKRHSELATFFSVVVLLVLITVIFPTIKVLFNGDNKQPKEADIESVTAFLPQDGVYSDPIGTGGSYRDPINGLYELDIPGGFIPKTLGLYNATNGSMVFFNKEDIEISVGVFRAKDELGRMSESIKFHRKRFVTFDGVQALERLYAFRKKQILWIRYEKHGFVNDIHIFIPFGQFPQYSDSVLAFLRSYRSLRPPR